MTQIITPVILSGGAGTRLWPLSVPEHPKQFLKLSGDLTMLQATGRRACDPARFSAPIVVASAAHADVVEAQLAEIGCSPTALLLEPTGRNTAPAIALAALTAAPDALLLVMPSDHVIGDEAAFGEAVARATVLAANGWLVTFGIEPDEPATGFGYIRLGDPLGDGLNRVERFVEKPARDAAERMLIEGGYAWNSGIFLFRADAFLAALADHAPAILDSVRASLDAARREGARIMPDPTRFAATPSDSIDYAVMEKADRVAVAPVSMAWSDVGSWDAVHALGPAGKDATVSIGDIVAIDTSNCLIRSDGPTIAALGVSDLIVVATEGHVLILARGRSQEVRRLVDALKTRA